MIGEFNRENPYVIQIMENVDPMKEKALECTKLLIRTLIYETLMSFTCTLMFIGVWPVFFLCICFMITKILSRIYQWKLVVSTNPVDEITRIIYGNEYEKIYVNNEKLLKLIQAIAAFNEKVVFLSKSFEGMVRFSIAETVILILMRFAFPMG